MTITKIKIETNLVKIRPHDIYLSTEGLIKTAISWEKPEVVNILQKISVTMINLNFLSKQPTTLILIIKASEGKNRETRFFDFLHRIDL